MTTQEKNGQKLQKETEIQKVLKYKNDALVMINI